MTKLPPELEAKRDEFTTSPWPQELKDALKANKNDVKAYNICIEQIRLIEARAFQAGVTERDKYLASQGDEFDKTKCHNEKVLFVSKRLSNSKTRNKSLKTNMDVAFYVGARWQHEQSKLKYEAKIRKIHELVTWTQDKHDGILESHEKLEAKIQKLEKEILELKIN